MEASGSSETLVPFYQTVQGHILDSSNPDISCLEKSQILRNMASFAWVRIYTFNQFLLFIEISVYDFKFLF
jgi:hypothetical protein